MKSETKCPQNGQTIRCPNKTLLLDVRSKNPKGRRVHMGCPQNVQNLKPKQTTVKNITSIWNANNKNVTKPTGVVETPYHGAGLKATQ